MPSWFDRLLGPQATPGPGGSRTAQGPSGGPAIIPVAPGGTGGEVPFRKLLSWLVPGWGLQSSGVPNALNFGDGAIPLAHDPFLLGWAFALQPIRIRMVAIANAAAATGLLLGQVDVNGTGMTWTVDGPGAAGGLLDLTLQYRLIALTVQHTGGAGPGQVTMGFSTSRVKGDSGNIPQIATTFIAQGGVFATMAGIPSAAGTAPVGFGIPSALWVPAPLDVQVSFPATAVGETYVFAAMVIGLPANSPAIG